ncbi:SLATT domain-containing protein [bacterium]|jgi:L-rhamnose mutarotase|nr:SLATT domain-containing protein [bacterium]
MENNKFLELKRRMMITATNRFNANTRLNRHNKFSLWTVISFSLGLIFVSIINVVHINSIINSSYIDISLIFFSVTILAISTALTMSNFGARAEKFLDSGRELHALVLDFEKIIDDISLQNITNYEKYQKEYEHILSRYENHKLIDHKTTKIKNKNEYNQKWYNYIDVFIRNILEYTIYIVLFFIELYCLYYLIKN